jgi:hypothetical protein
MATQVTLNSGSVDSAGSLALKTNGTTTAVTIDPSQNVGIGTSSPVGKLHVTSASAAAASTAGAPIILQAQSGGSSANGGNVLIGSGSNGSGAANGYIAFGIGSATSGSAFSSGEFARIDSSGNLLVGTTDTAFSSGVGAKFIASATVPAMGYVVNTAGNLNTYHFYNTNATNNGFRFYVNINGGIYNFSGNNSNLSDERSKTNIEMAGGYLEKMCAIPVKLFNYKDEPTGEQRTLGVIAQDVEAVAPELVNNEGFGETPQGEAPLKSVYTTDMMFALMKSIQELKALVDTQASTITQLQADVAAMKGTA